MCYGRFEALVDTPLLDIINLLFVVNTIAERFFSCLHF
jgi:hypothetical protein